MDLFCPHCTRRVSVADDKAGLITNCPLCGKQFMAPSLAPASAPKPPAPSPTWSAPLETYVMENAPAPPAPMFEPPPPSRPDPAAPPPPPLPPGEYTRSFSCALSDRWLAFVPPVCVFLIFLLSFFTWHGAIIALRISDSAAPASLWGLSMTSDKIQANFVLYTILMFLCLPLTFVALPFDKGWLAPPPGLAHFMTFKNLLIGLLLGLAFLMLCIDYAQGHFSSPTNPITVPFKVAIRLQFLAMIASFAMFWLNWRKRKNLPLPKVEVRW